MRSVRVTIRETGTVRGTTRRPDFSLAIISVTVQLRIWVFWVRSVYFNVRNILPKSGTFPPGHPVYIYIPSIIFQENPFSFFSVHFKGGDRRAELNMYSGRKPTRLKGNLFVLLTTWSLDSGVSIMTRLWAGRPKNLG